MYEASLPPRTPAVQRLTSDSDEESNTPTRRLSPKELREPFVPDAEESNYERTFLRNLKKQKTTGKGIDILENLAPDFSVAFSDGTGQKSENLTIGSVILNATRTDADTDTLTYSLADDFGGTFAINSSTGQVTLNNALDFETTSSYDLRVIATDSKGVTREILETMQVLSLIHI